MKILTNFKVNLIFLIQIFYLPWIQWLFNVIYGHRDFKTPIKCFNRYFFYKTKDTHQYLNFKSWNPNLLKNYRLQEDFVPWKWRNYKKSKIDGIKSISLCTKLSELKCFYLKILILIERSWKISTTMNTAGKTTWKRKPKRNWSNERYVV